MVVEDYVQFPIAAINNLNGIDDSQELQFGVKLELSEGADAGVAADFLGMFGVSSSFVASDETTISAETTLSAGQFKTLVDYPANDPTLVESLHDWFLPYYGDTGFEESLESSAFLAPAKFLNDLNRDDTPIGLLKNGETIDIVAQLESETGVEAGGFIGANFGLVGGGLNFTAGVTFERNDNTFQLESWQIAGPSFQPSGASTNFLATQLAGIDISNVTVLTHGFQLGDTDGDSMLDLALDIQSTQNSLSPTTQTFLLDYDISGAGRQGLFDVQYVRDDNGNSLLPVSGATANIVLLYDWAPDSGEQSDGWGAAAGDSLFAMLVDLGLVDPSAGGENPDFHFIGHSFGTAVTSEAVERMARFGIPVDHVTLLDPHDFDQGLTYDTAQRLWTIGRPDSAEATTGYGVTVWDNVSFTDVYYETRGSNDGSGLPDAIVPQGRPIPGAYNRFLNDGEELPDISENPYSLLFDGASGDHSYVWNGFYRATVTGQLPADSPHPELPTNYADTGYAFSKIRMDGGLGPTSGQRPSPTFFDAFQDHTWTDASYLGPLSPEFQATVANQQFATNLNPLEVVNGDFSDVGPDNDSPSPTDIPRIPGWSGQYGGGGRGSVSFDHLELTLQEHQHRRVHNLQYIPREAVGVALTVERSDSFHSDIPAAVASWDNSRFEWSLRPDFYFVEVRLDGELLGRPYDLADLNARPDGLDKESLFVPIPSHLQNRASNLEIRFVGPRSKNSAKNNIVRARIDDVSYVYGGHTGDLIPIDLPRIIAWESGQQLPADTSFDQLLLEYYDNDAGWRTLGSVDDPARGDWRLELSDNGQSHVAGYVLFPDRIEGTAGTLHGFGNTGKFWLAPATGQLPGAVDQNADETGFQGRVRIRYRLNGSDYGAKEIRVGADRSQSGPRAVQAEPPLVALDRTLETAKLQQRLNFLGYVDSAGEPLAVDGIVGDLTRHAAGLFNAAATDADLSTSDWADVSLINRATAPRWVEFPTPADPASSGWDNQAAGNHWGTDWAMDIVSQAGQFLASNPLELLLASRPAGGDAPSRGHHEAGRDLEFKTPAAQAIAGAWVSPYYRTHDVNGSPIIAGRTGNDTAGSDHVIRRVSGTAAAYTDPTSRSKIKFAQLPDLSKIRAVLDDPGDADAYILLHTAHDGWIQRQIQSVNVAEQEMIILPGLPESITEAEAVDFEILHTVPLTDAGQTDGLATHQVVNATDRVLLRGIAPLITDNPKNGYDVGAVAAQVEAVRTARPESGVRVRNVVSGDPRLWGLRGTLSFDQPNRQAMYEPGY